MRTRRFKIRRRVALLLTALLGASGCSGATLSSPSEGSQSNLRRPLGDLAFEVSQRVRVGIVLADPSLHDLPLTIYFPSNASSKQVTSIFKAALHSHQLQVVEEDGFWMIERLNLSKINTETHVRSSQRGMIMDLDQVRLALVTRSLSQVAGYRFVLAPGLADHLVTIQALRPVPPEDALELLINTLSIDGIRVARDGHTVTFDRPSNPAVDPTLPTSRPAIGASDVGDGLIIPANLRHLKNGGRPLPELQ